MGEQLTSTTQTRTSDGRDSPDRPRTLARGDGIGRYVVLDEIGHGGMGVVYAAYDPELDRKLAIKLLHATEGERAEARRLRLVREAQAMARVKHPNVIAVHDVGTQNEQVFVAMEYVDGEGLRKWMMQPRPWKQVLQVVCHAGAGLAAAHAAGLVHRDFKPDNVMIDRDGRVVVTDFGLARASGGAVDGDSGSQHDVSISRSLSTTVTAAGAIMGTPAYMAPEQHEGRPADARSDQFAFAVAAWEALWGERPFPGEEITSLAYNVLSGHVREPPARSSVPGWIRPILLRALAVDPARRHPSMRALLGELQRDRSMRPRWGAVLLGGVVATGFGMYAGFALDPEPRPCAGARERTGEVWNDARAQEVHAALARSGQPWVDEQWPAIEGELDRFARGWADAYVDACEANVRGEQSDALLDLRMQCLGRRLDELSALVELLAGGEPGTVERALPAVQSLHSLRLCEDTGALQSPIPPPDDPAIAGEVEMLRPELARVSALERAGMHEAGLHAAQALVARTEQLGYPPLHAEALHRLAAFERALGEWAGAEAHEREALSLAIEGHADRAAALAAVALVDIVGRDGAREREADGWAQLAQALLSRTGGDAELELQLLEVRARARLSSGDLAGARAQLERVLELREQAHGSDDMRVADAAFALARVHERLGDDREARRLYEHALRGSEYALGLEHPRTGEIFAALGAVELRLHDRRAALASLSSALAVGERAHGERSVELVPVLIGLARAQLALDRVDEAEQSLERARKLVARGDARVADVLSVRAALALRRGRARDAYDDARSARPLLLARLGADAQAVAEIDVLVAESLLGLDRGNEAEVAASALALRLRDDDPLRVRALSVLGRAALAAGDAHRAADTLERALALVDATGDDPEAAARIRFALAQARWASDPAAAQRLAVTAREHAETAGEPAKALRTDIDAWLAERAGDR